MDVFKHLCSSVYAASFENKLHQIYPVSLVAYHNDNHVQLDSKYSISPRHVYGFVALLGMGWGEWVITVFFMDKYDLYTHILQSYYKIAPTPGKQSSKIWMISVNAWPQQSTTN